MSTLLEQSSSGGHARLDTLHPLSALSHKQDLISSFICSNWRRAKQCHCIVSFFFPPWPHWERKLHSWKNTHRCSLSSVGRLMEPKHINKSSLLKAHKQTDYRYNESNLGLHSKIWTLIQMLEANTNGVSQHLQMFASFVERKVRLFSADWSNSIITQKYTYTIYVYVMYCGKVLFCKQNGYSDFIKYRWKYSLMYFIFMYICTFQLITILMSLVASCHFFKYLQK